MLDLRHARRALTVSAIGLGLGFLVCASRTQADEFNSFLFDPYPVLQIASPTFQLASLTPVETPREAPAYRISEPFGAETSALVKGGLQNKWASVEKKLPHERRVLMRCRANAETCPPAAKRFLAVLDKASTLEGWARVRDINRAINLNIRPVDDMTQYGVIDLWASPLMTFASNAGDCEDYAIAKYVALQEVGIARDDLRLVIVHDRVLSEDHAVTAIRYDGRWHILDNRTLDIRQDADIAEFDPLFVIDSEGVKRMTPLASKPTSPPDTVSPAAMNLEISAGWQSAPLLM